MTIRMGIVVPYRNREKNLAEFMPAIRAFFSREDQRRIVCSMLIVEQEAGLPFNRGAIKNIGYQYLSKANDYVCFHDVDLVPIDADYYWPRQPTMVAFHGLDFKPDFVRNLFGGVVVIKNTQFEAANGYSNDYWQWGYEDVDLRERLLRCNLRPGHREGIFKKLAHVDEGSLHGGLPTAGHLESKQRFTNRWFQQVEAGWTRKLDADDKWHRDGLNSLRFHEVVARHTIAAQGDRTVAVDRVMIALEGPTNLVDN
jgi:hypothetical protein